MNLTTELKDALTRGEAVRLSEPHMQIEWVAIRADIYHRIATLMGLDEFTPSVGYEAFRCASGEELDDPGLDAYEQYRKK